MASELLYHNVANGWIDKFEPILTVKSSSLYRRARSYRRFSASRKYIKAQTQDWRVLDSVMNRISRYVEF